MVPVMLIDQNLAKEIDDRIEAKNPWSFPELYKRMA